MNKFRFTIKIMTIAIFMFAFASLAQAQATRTWVSGVGDDANPCSRTAPCKTFAGAISKTAGGGEIDCLDPGGFGTVTITKSLTIDGTYGAGFGSILAAGTNGVNVNDSASGAPNTINVFLRNLSIQGAGTGLIGINFTSGKALFIENCVIRNFRAGSGHGINVSLTAGGGIVNVTDSIIGNNLADGIRATTTSGTLRVGIDNCKIDKNDNGVHMLAGALAVVTRSVISNNVTNGAFADSGSNVILDSNFIHSTATGGATGSGVRAVGTVRMANNHIVGQQNGVNIAGGTAFTFGDNKIRGNVNDVTGGSLDTTTTKQ